MTETKTVQLGHGPIRYRETGPQDGEPIVFVHGFLVDSRLWDGAAEALSGEFRCIQPDLPMGSHRLPMKPDADLTPPGFARMIADFLEALELEHVTIVGNDSGGAMSQILVTSHPERIARLVLTNCDSFEHFPPGSVQADASDDEGARRDERDRSPLPGRGLGAARLQPVHARHRFPAS